MAAYKTLAAGVAAAFLILPFAAAAQPLTVVTLDGSAEACVFSPQCTDTVKDTIGVIPLPLLTSAAGTAWLQSRTYPGLAGSPGAGKTAYEYRVSFTQAAGTGCVSGLVVNFGPVAPLAYKNNQLADVYVITTGGLGTVGLASAEQDGDAITFTFSTPLCVAPAPSNAATTFFFGLASTATPMAIEAGLFAQAVPSYFQVDARAPTHAVAPPGGDPPAPPPGPLPPAAPKNLIIRQ